MLHFIVWYCPKKVSLLLGFIQVNTNNNGTYFYNAQTPISTGETTWDMSDELKLIEARNAVKRQRMPRWRLSVFNVKAF